MTADEVEDGRVERLGELPERRMATLHGDPLGAQHGGVQAARLDRWNQHVRFAGEHQRRKPERVEPLGRVVALDGGELGQEARGGQLDPGDAVVELLRQLALVVVEEPDPFDKDLRQ